MCGISGIISPAGYTSRALRTMNQALRHRGPDDEGYWVHPRGGRPLFAGGSDTVTSDAAMEDQEITVGLAHRRLSVIDTSAAGHQPMGSPDNRYIVAFNGEIYNYPELRKSLTKHGYTFRTNSDTEVLLRAYRQWGVECFKRFRGMWACAIADMETKSILLCRDRYGIKPLYLTEADYGWAFASEVKAMISAGLYRPQADENEAISFLAHGTVTKPYSTVFSGITELKPGTWMQISWNGRKVDSGSYYNLDLDTKPIYPTQAGSLQAGFEDLFAQSIDLHLRCDVTMGGCLSGGLDSSAITSYAVDRLDDSPFKTITASYPEHVLDETHYARQVIEHLGKIQAYEVMPEADGLWNDFNALAYAQEMPFASSSIYAQWSVMRAASEAQIKVLLDGQGADELLGGYYNYAGLWLVELARAGKYRKALKAYFDLNRHFTSGMDQAVFRALYYQLPAEMARGLRSWKRAGVSLLTKEARRVFKAQDIPARGGSNFAELTRQSIRFNLNELLRYEDRNAMAFSVESRVPFLDHRLVNYIIGAPTSWKIHEGWTKHPLRLALRSKLPRQIVWRKDKLGFVTPQAMWKRHLSSRIEEWLHSITMPDMLNRQAVLNLAGGEQTTSSSQSEFWRIISFLKWYELFMR